MTAAGTNQNLLETHLTDASPGPQFTVLSSVDLVTDLPLSSFSLWLTEKRMRLPGSPLHIFPSGTITQCFFLHILSYMFFRTGNDHCCHLSKNDVNCMCKGISLWHTEDLTTTFAPPKIFSRAQHRQTLWVPHTEECYWQFHSKTMAQVKEIGYVWNIIFRLIPDVGHQWLLPIKLFFYFIWRIRLVQEQQSHIWAGKLSFLLPLLYGALLWKQKGGWTASELT